MLGTPADSGICRVYPGCIDLHIPGWGIDLHIPGWCIAGYPSWVVYSRVSLLGGVYTRVYQVGYVQGVPGGVCAGCTRVGIGGYPGV